MSSGSLLTTTWRRELAAAAPPTYSSAVLPLAAGLVPAHRRGRPRSGAHAFPQRQVGATPVQQRACAVVTDLDVLHTADHDLVITARQPVLDRALQRGQDPVQPRAAGRAGPVPDSVPGGSEAPAGEVGGKLLLWCCEHVDHERAVRADRP